MKIIRKDGIVYEKKPKVINNDTKICIRVSKELLEEYKKKTKQKGISYSKHIRKCMEEFIKEN